MDGSECSDTCVVVLFRCAELFLRGGSDKTYTACEVRAGIPAMLGHKTAVWYAWEHRERRGRGGGHKEEVLLLKRFVAEKIRC